MRALGLGLGDRDWANRLLNVNEGQLRVRREGPASCPQWGICRREEECTGPSRWGSGGRCLVMWVPWWMP